MFANTADLNRHSYGGYDESISTDAAIQWLLASSEPGERLLARRDLLGEPIPNTDEALAGPMVQALLAGQQPDGGFGVHPYRSILTIGGLARRHASQEGNALAVCSRLGMAADPRVQLLAESLIEWQWPDGGWNCDRHKGAHRSSFHESLPATWGLFEYSLATGSTAAKAAARRAAELFLEHRLFRSLITGSVIHPQWLVLHYPPYWHYDILQALLVLSRMGLARDARCADALGVLEQRRRRDGHWQPGGYWWAAPAKSGSPDVVDWGRSGPSEMITLNALRVLQAAGRSSPE